MIYDLEDLRKAYIAGEKFKFVFFWGHTASQDGQIHETCFSQWWPSCFTVDGVAYTCAEQFMMAEKARMFGDEEMREKILQTRQPKEMKAYGRAVKNFDEAQWKTACCEIVKKGNLAKFSQNQDLWDYMKNTKKRILVEASPRDRIWGIGMGKQNPDAENPVKWRGTNFLGFTLMEVRDLLTDQEAHG